MWPEWITRAGESGRALVADPAAVARLEQHVTRYMLKRRPTNADPSIPTWRCGCRVPHECITGSQHTSPRHTLTESDREQRISRQRVRGAHAHEQGGVGGRSMRAGCVRLCACERVGQWSFNPHVLRDTH